MQRGKEEKPRRVGDSVTVGRLSHLDGCLLLPVRQEQSSALPPPAVVRRCFQEELAWSLQRVQATEQAAASPAFLWPIDQGPVAPAAARPSSTVHPSSLWDFSIRSSGSDLLL